VRKTRKRKGIALSQEEKDRFRALRLEAGLSKGELADLAGLSKRTISNIESTDWMGEGHLEEHLQKIARALGTDLNSLRRVEGSASGVERLPTTFAGLVSLAEHVDHALLRTIRASGLLSRDERAQVYADLLSKRLQDRGVTLARLLGALCDQDWMQGIINSLPEPDLVVSIPSAIERITFESSEDQRLDVRKPLLLWDCSCRISSRDSKKLCPIHRHGSLGIEVASRFMHGNVCFQSMDSLLLSETLRQSRVMEEEIHSIVDIGSGTGFLATLIGVKNAHVVRIIATDWLLTPIIYSSVNWHLNAQKKRYASFIPRVEYSISLPILEQSNDLAICNPPYLPISKEHEHLGLESTVAGTELLEEFIVKARLLGKRSLINYSVLADQEARRAVSTSKCKLIPVGTAKELPLRLSKALDQPEYVQTLVARGLIDKPKERHRYWHSIRCYSIERMEASEPKSK